MIRTVNIICIHCTATPPTTKVSSILNYWRNSLGWRNPGYHRLIDASGRVHILHPFERPSNGVKGYNSRSIHISYIGGVDAYGNAFDTRTEAQQDGLIEQIQEAQQWIIGHGLPPAEVIGHHDLNPFKACPSFPAKLEYSWL